MREDEDMTLTEFLLARIAEDEATYAAMGRDFAVGPRFASRLLVECEAKRRIVREYLLTCEPTGLMDRLVFPTAAAALGHALEALALPYADHPDYDESWRP